MIFNTEFHNSIIPGNFQKFPGIQDIALELASEHDIFLIFKAKFKFSDKN